MVKTKGKRREQTTRDFTSLAVSVCDGGVDVFS
jgi:hypothetical protein